MRNTVLKYLPRGMYSLFESARTVIPMIVITGASGHLGRLVVDELAERVDPSTIVATARTPEKIAELADRGIEVRRLDYNDADSIAAALDGADQVLLISGSEIGRRVDQHSAVIDAAVAAGVDHIAYTSILRADTSTLRAAEEHLATERLLADSGLTVSLLRHGWYIENYTENADQSIEHGTVIGAAGDGRIAAATRADLAAADAAVLADPALHGGTYELAGEAFTMAEHAEALAEATGQEISYVDMPAADYRSALVGAGVPEPMADFLADADLGIAKGELDGDPSTLRRLAGRRLTTMREATDAAVAAR